MEPDSRVICKCPACLLRGPGGKHVARSTRYSHLQQQLIHDARPSIGPSTLNKTSNNDSSEHRDKRRKTAGAFNMHAESPRGQANSAIEDLLLQEDSDPRDHSVEPQPPACSPSPPGPHLHYSQTPEIELPNLQLQAILAAASAGHPLPLLRNSLTFIRSLQNATLDNNSLLPLVLQRLCTPLQHCADMTDPNLRCLIKMFLGSLTASEEVYTIMRDACMEQNPNNQILTGSGQTEGGRT
ncbi:hypothetical protein HETIRDRAFT_171542 [Heterobasidion irregulare TC 32-1]|uniref:Uncharacterized protein n=1 Tax=Heterobasidion irregulare (strain TC 32-1) TaxID=747525 RepID=W4K4H2_HETIT|nr:uncharacterized protein HETIRDRAFT_171542 [Heterobasidion irregulare TC 32-1]ETW79941.1 hypothetical protein HETIRDRAFT_171542 [Heterobasidion irregulare TC 32-1]